MLPTPDRHIFAIAHEDAHPCSRRDIDIIIEFLFPACRYFFCPSLLILIPRRGF